VKKQTIKGFISTKINYIDEMQSKGFYLSVIYEEIKQEFGTDFAFKTFKDALYKIRNASKDKIDSSKIKSIDNNKNHFEWNNTDKNDISF
jgi:hypothetical protein